MTEDERYMQRCLQLASNGLKNAIPNPMVGAVIVCDGRIIGEGYHVCCGQAHAEVNAVKSLRLSAIKSLQGADNRLTSTGITEMQIQQWIFEH